LNVPPIASENNVNPSLGNACGIFGHGNLSMLKRNNLQGNIKHGLPVQHDWQPYFNSGEGFSVEKNCVPWLAKPYTRAIGVMQHDHYRLRDALAIAVESTII
jgi:hypothetical protein